MPVTVAQLIATLQTLPPNALALIACDIEGLDVRPILSDVPADDGRYDTNSATYWGHATGPRDEGPPGDFGIAAVCIWPAW